MALLGRAWRMPGGVEWGRAQAWGRALGGPFLLLQLSPEGLVRVLLPGDLKKHLVPSLCHQDWGLVTSDIFAGTTIDPKALVQKLDSDMRSVISAGTGKSGGGKALVVWLIVRPLQTRVRPSD